MFLNLLVAFSNLPAIYPIYQAYANQDYLTAGVLTFVATASFVSHLVENHKHSMPGIGFSKEVSYYLNRADVLGCLLTGARVAQLYYLKYGFSFDVILENKLFFLLYCLPVILMRISEHDKYNPKLRNIYVVTHSLWHATIFMTMNSFLSKFIY